MVSTWLSKHNLQTKRSIDSKGLVPPGWAEFDPDILHARLTVVATPNISDRSVKNVQAAVSQIGAGMDHGAQPSVSLTVSTREGVPTRAANASESVPMPEGLCES
jgi:hypothetical protein